MPIWRSHLELIFVADSWPNVAAKKIGYLARCLEIQKLQILSTQEYLATAPRPDALVIFDALGETPSGEILAKLPSGSLIVHSSPTGQANESLYAKFFVLQVDRPPVDMKNHLLLRDQHSGPSPWFMLSFRQWLLRFHALQQQQNPSCCAQDLLHWGYSPLSVETLSAWGMEQLGKALNDHLAAGRLEIYTDGKYIFFDVETSLSQRACQHALANQLPQLRQGFAEVTKTSAGKSRVIFLVQATSSHPGFRSRHGLQEKNLFLVLIHQDEKEFTHVIQKAG